MNSPKDDWQKLTSYEIEAIGRLHADVLKNKGIHVSIQVLSAIPGLNSGVTLWVQQADLNTAKQILADL